MTRQRCIHLRKTHRDIPLWFKQITDARDTNTLILTRYPISIYIDAIVDIIYGYKNQVASRNLAHSFKIKYDE